MLLVLSCFSMQVKTPHLETIYHQVEVLSWQPCSLHSPSAEERCFVSCSALLWVDVQGNLRSRSGIAKHSDHLKQNRGQSTEEVTKLKNPAPEAMWGLGQSSHNEVLWQSTRKHYAWSIQQDKWNFPLSLLEKHHTTEGTAQASEKRCSLTTFLPYYVNDEMRWTILKFFLKKKSAL